ncbi:uncharacterized protein LOC127871273 isoform X1 [Dreissena polymorpha]|uniref:uncharacterized protein LOC127871273 isoform X1 n=1 Tax=Dreissena polymorpha TaxID=45954 RepID=UPI0022644A57|nr:uncharacterized protein LOC127871273 isoform X1 [Dreissena polymorpha]
MKTVLYKLQILLAIQVSTCQDISWTWLSGQQTGNGVQTTDQPSARSGAAFWQQKDQQVLWMFGGESHVEHSRPEVKNDLWQYKEGKWKLEHNGSTTDAPPPRHLAAACGVDRGYMVLFGGLGKSTDNLSSIGDDDIPLGDTWVFYFVESKWYTLHDFYSMMGSPGNISLLPSARGDMASWCVPGNRFTVFGGFGDNSTLHHDLWWLDLMTLTWSTSKLSSSLPKNGDFVSLLNYPNGRSGAMTWVNEGKYYMFGGNTRADNARRKHLPLGYVNDMWLYDVKADMWNYLSGSRDKCSIPGAYGNLGTADKKNLPGCRRKSSAWVDIHGNLWMFGGDGVDQSLESISGHSELLSDVWLFDTAKLTWTWKGGSNKADEKGVFDEQGKKSKEAHPGSRCESVVWMDTKSDMPIDKWYFYLFGGVGHDANGQDGYLNDVWRLDVNLDPSVLKNAPYPAPIFTVIVLAFSLIIFVVVIFAFSRKFFLTERVSKLNIKYSKIEQIED